MKMFFIVPLVSLLAVAVWYDVRLRIIPNWLTFGGTFIGLVLALIGFGREGFFNHLSSAFVIGGIWYGFWRFQLVGGGDQKLMFAIGTFLGTRCVVPVLLGVAVCGALQAILTVFVRSRALSLVSYRQAIKQISVPYSIAIAVGALLAVWWG